MNRLRLLRIRIACALMLVATAVNAATAQAPERFTVNRLVKYAPGTDKVRARLGSIPAARAIVAGDFAIAAEDLDDDGRKEIILRSREFPRCRQAPCPLLVLRQTPNGAETLFDQLVPPSDLAVTNEKVDGFRALVAVNRTGELVAGDRTGKDAHQVYAMRNATAVAGSAATAPPKDAATTKAVRGGLVGRLVSDQAAIDEAFLRAVDCNSAAPAARHQGSLRGRRFQFIWASCPFEGGNAEWSAFLVAFHDGQQITQAIAFKGSLNVASFIGSKNDRIVYEAAVTRPDDARCCPSGKAIVEIDVDRQLATARAIGFSTRYDSVRGKVLK